MNMYKCEAFSEDAFSYCCREIKKWANFTSSYHFLPKQGVNAPVDFHPYGGSWISDIRKNMNGNLVL